MTEYVHKVYGTARALVQDEASGWIREATPEEARVLSEKYAKDLANSFLLTEAP